MSTKVMSSCWPVETDPSAKAVLISLADQSNDDGICWPGVGTIADRTCLCERAVQDAIGRLESEGHLTRQLRTGKSTVYRLHPRSKCTPAPDAPPQQVRNTPAPDAPPGVQQMHPNHQLNRKEPSKRADALPAWLPIDAWNDWEAYRKSRKGWTAKARQLSLSTLTRLHAEGHDPRKVIETAIERGWTGLFPLKDSPLKASNDFMRGAL